MVYRSTARLFAIAAALLLAAVARAENRWPDERQAGPLLVHANFSLAQEETLLEELALLQQDLAGVLGAKQSKENVHLFLFHTKETYQAYLKQYFPRVPYRRALYIKARGPGMVFAFQGDEFAIDVRHETTHALLHAWLPSVPLWLDEGLAEYFEASRDERPAGNPHLATVQAMIRYGQFPRLEELEKLRTIDEMGRDEYRDAWAWTHFMLHGPREAGEELRRYLDDLAAGGEIGPLSERLRRRLPDLNRRMVDHFR